MRFLLEFANSRGCLKPSFSYYSEPKFTFVSLLVHYCELRDEEWSGVGATNCAVVRGYRRASIEELLTDSAPRHAIGERVTEFHDRYRECLSAGFELLRLL